MIRSSCPGTVRFLTAFLLLLVSASLPARSQGPMAAAPSLDGFAAGTRAFGEGWLPPNGSSSYLPLPGWGGFVPYTPGPGRGLGLMAGVRNPALNVPATGMSMSGGPSSLGRVPASLTPPGPISIGSGRGMGQAGMATGLTRSMRGAGSMPMARPPVGSYPFRIPPSLFGPATAGPAMSM
jgi:hypothetical protein